MPRSFSKGHVTSGAPYHVTLTTIMAEAEAARALGALLSGVAQKVFFGKAEITEELLREQLFPELSAHDFRALYERMSGLLKVKQSAVRPAGRQGELHPAPTVSLITAERPQFHPTIDETE